MTLTPKQKEVVERLKDAWLLSLNPYGNFTIQTPIEEHRVNRQIVTSLIKKGIIDSNYKLIT